MRMFGSREIRIDSARDVTMEDVVLSSSHAADGKAHTRWASGGAALFGLGFIFFLVLYHRSDLRAIQAAPTLVERIKQIQQPLLEYIAGIFCAVCALSIQSFPHLRKRLFSVSDSPGDSRSPRKLLFLRWALLLLSIMAVSLYLGEDLEGFLFPSLRAPMQVTGSLLLLAFYIFGPFVGGVNNSTTIPFLSIGNGEARRPLVLYTPIVIAIVLTIGTALIFCIHFIVGLVFPSSALVVTALCSVPISIACLIFWLLQWGAKQP